MVKICHLWWMSLYEKSKSIIEPCLKYINCWPFLVFLHTARSVLIRLLYITYKWSQISSCMCYTWSDWRSYLSSVDFCTFLVAWLFSRHKERGHHRRSSWHLYIFILANMRWGMIGFPKKDSSSSFFAGWVFIWAYLWSYASGTFAVLLSSK